MHQSVLLIITKMASWPYSVFLLVFISVTSRIGVAQEFVVTETQYGYVRGNVLRNVDNGEFSSHVASYFAVPFATAERFEKPSRDFSPWTGLRETNWTACRACPQPPDTFWLTHPGWNDYGEDCLQLNIFTPFESSDPGPYPVMVYFYGGAFRTGGNLGYPGHFLASRDVVVVTANYRLNDFGFSYTGTDACVGNFGLWDQAAALEFVQENIANFGGDPNKVTIFGQSAGAASVSFHMVSPITQTLFHQAITISGTESNFWSMNGPEQSPENYIWELAENLDCVEPGFTDQDMIDCLKELPWEDFIRTRFRCAEGHFCMGMQPVVDGEGGFLPEKPDALRESGNINKGPLMTGITHDDGSYYTFLLAPRSLLGGFTREEFHKYVNRFMSIWAPQMEAKNDTETLENAFWAIDYQYTPWPYINDTYENREALNKLITDAAFGHPWDQQIKDHSQYVDCYGYVYNYRGRNYDDRFPEWMGIPHAADLLQVWGWSLLPLNPHIREDTGMMTDFIEWTDEDRRQTVFWQTMLTNFAKYGNPSPNPVDNPAGDPITWPPFTPEDMSILYVHNVTTDIRTEWKQKSYAFWGEYLIGYITDGYEIPIYAQTADNVTNSEIASPTSTGQEMMDEIRKIFQEMNAPDFV